MRSSGFLEHFGPLTAEAFVGIAAIEHDVQLQGRAYAPKCVAEFWLNVGESAWSSLDATWTSARETYAGRLRSGYRLFNNVSVGVEARVDGNELDKEARGDMFVRYAWHGGEVSVAGGIGGRFFSRTQTTCTTSTRRFAS